MKMKTFVLACLGLITLSATTGFAKSIPPECSSVEIRYRGNYLINDLNAQKSRARRYLRQLSANPLTEEADVRNRLSAVVTSLESTIDENVELQQNCGCVNPEYSVLCPARAL